MSLFQSIIDMPYTDAKRAYRLSIVNAQERTENEYKSLASKSGWKHVKTWKTGENGEGSFRHYEFEKEG